MDDQAARQDIAVSELKKFYELVGDLLVGTTHRSRRIQLVSIALSVLTTGVLWALIASSVPVAAAWAGAIATTILSFIQLYQATIGPQRKIDELQKIYEDAGEYLAKLVSSRSFDYHEFADTVRRLEKRIRSIETVHQASFVHAMLTQPRWYQEEVRRVDQANEQIKDDLTYEIDFLKRQMKADDAGKS